MKVFSHNHKKPAQMPRRRQEVRRPQPQNSNENNAFRRNKTLTGSGSSGIKSAGEKSAQLQSDRTHAHRLVHLRRRIGSTLGFTLLGALGVYLLINQFTAQLELSVMARPDVDTSRYNQVIQEYYGKHPIERLRFMLDETTLTKFIQAKAPEIRSLQVGPGSQLATSQVRLVARQPVASWRIDQKKQYVDRSGVAFVQNYYKAPSVSVVDKSGVPSRRGEAVASNRFLGFVGMLVADVHDRDYTVKRVVIPPETTRQIQLKLKGVSTTIKCSVDRSAGEQAEDIDRVLSYLKKKHRSPGYVDVRVEGRAFYK